MSGQIFHIHRFACWVEWAGQNLC